MFEGFYLVLPSGFEPPTSSLGNCCSILLSYGSNDIIIPKKNKKNKTYKKTTPKDGLFLAPPNGIEPPTRSTGNYCSIQ